MASSIAKTSNWAAASAVAVLVAALVWSQNGPAQTIEAERASLARAKADAARAAERASQFEVRAAAEQSEERKAQMEAAAVATRIQSAEATIAAAESRVRLVERLQADVRGRLAEKQEPAVRLVAALQTLSRRPPLLALVQPGSVRDMVHVRAVLNGVLPELRKRTVGLRADLERARRLRADAQQAVGALAAGRQQLAMERQVLVQLAARHRQASQTLTGSALIEQDRAIGMGERARDISDLIGQLSVDAEVRAQLESLPGPVLRPGDPAATRALPATAAASDNRRLPYRLPVGGSLVAGLGEVSPSGIRARGLTIATRPNAQVVSPAEGRIVFAGPFRGFGDIVIIDHGKGWTTLIANLGARDVRVGDRVIQGGPIGRAGGEKPQVLVELRHDMRPIDIAWLLG